MLNEEEPAMAAKDAKQNDVSNHTHTSGGIAAAAPTAPNHYDVLGVALNATAAQIQSAHKKMSMVYHPDRNPNDEVAAAKLVTINEAYSVLSDAEKRDAYDVSIHNTTRGAADGSTAMSSLGGIGKAIGTFADRLASSIPLFTADMPDDMMQVAKEIVKETDFNAPGPVSYAANPKNPNKMLAHVSYSTLQWGNNTEARVDRMTNQYFRLSVTEEQADAGFLIQCRSARADKFKLFIFNGTDGTMMYCGDSRKSRDKTSSQVVMYFNTAFDVYDCVESGNTSTTAIGATTPVPNPTSMNAAAFSVQTKGKYTVSTTNNKINVAVDLPPLFSRVESFESCRKKISGPGNYLVAVFGENYMQRSICNLVAVPCNNNSTELPLMAEHDNTVMAVRKALPELQERYNKAKAAYDAVLFEIGRDSDRLDTLLQTRDMSYRGFVLESMQACNPTEYGQVADTNTAAAGVVNRTEGADEPPLDPNSGSGPHIRGMRLRRDSLNEVASAATAAATAAATQASAATTAATGWVSSKVGKFRSSFAGGSQSSAAAEASASASAAPAATATAVPADEDAKAAAAAASVEKTEAEVESEPTAENDAPTVESTAEVVEDEGDV